MREFSMLGSRTNLSLLSAQPMTVQPAWHGLLRGCVWQLGACAPRRPEPGWQPSGLLQSRPLAPASRPRGRPRRRQLRQLDRTFSSEGLLGHIMLHASGERWKPCHWCIAALYPRTQAGRYLSSGSRISVEASSVESTPRNDMVSGCGPGREPARCLPHRHRVCHVAFMGASAASGVSKAPIRVSSAPGLSSRLLLVSV